MMESILLFIRIAGKLRKGTIMYTPSRHFIDFCIAGFTFCEGAKALGDLKVGSKLKLQLELDNPYDPDAVALYYDGKKLGYIPKAKNSQIKQLLFFGHDVFETSVSQIDPVQHPERQVRVVIQLINAREL